MLRFKKFQVYPRLQLLYFHCGNVVPPKGVDILAPSYRGEASCRNIVGHIGSPLCLLNFDGFIEKQIVTKFVLLLPYLVTLFVAV